MSSPIYGHLGYFHLLSVRNNITVNFIYASIWVPIFNSLPRGEIVPFILIWRVRYKLNIFFSKGYFFVLALSHVIFLFINLRYFVCHMPNFHVYLDLFLNCFFPLFVSTCMPVPQVLPLSDHLITVLIFRKESLLPTSTLCPVTLFVTIALANSLLSPTDKPFIFFYQWHCEYLSNILIVSWEITVLVCI